MNLERYDLLADAKATTFAFTSTGPKGFIQKLIQFRQLPASRLYNLAFGDRIGESARLDDATVSDNGDAEKILATIVHAVYVFTVRYPDAIVYATGSTPARTRLYQMGLAKHLEAAQKDFDIWGEHEEVFEVFQKDRAYTAFIAARKKLKLDL